MSSPATKEDETLKSSQEYAALAEKALGDANNTVGGQVSSTREETVAQFHVEAQVWASLAIAASNVETSHWHEQPLANE
jgi:hypothetical protein